MGAYNSIDYYQDIEKEMSGFSVRHKVRSSFMDSFQVLKSLPENTIAQETDNGTFTMMYNLATHENTTLKEPEYEPKSFIDNTEYE